MKLALVLALCVMVAACTPKGPLGANPPQVSDVNSPKGRDAYEFQGIQQWFNLDGITNSTSLTKEDLTGKVVLVDFWTYSCINCIRTLPYLTSWDEKYRSEGLVIVGIHTPEFTFEHDPANVQKALMQYNISYPVGLDNNYSTWKEYQNDYWPHSYVFDRTGKLVFDHIGEGGYEEIEQEIQKLLSVKENMTVVALPDFQQIASPEIYMGAATSRGNIGYTSTTGIRAFEMPAVLGYNTVDLGGVWNITDEYIEASQNSSLQLLYHARDIHAVAGGNGVITGSVDGVVINPVTVDSQRLYTLSSTTYNDHILELNLTSGVQLYTFTFG